MPTKELKINTTNQEEDGKMLLYGTLQLQHTATATHLLLQHTAIRTTELENNTTNQDEDGMMLV